MKRLALLLLLLASPALAQEATPAPTPDAIATALPPSEGVDPRLLDPNTRVTHPTGALLGGLAPRRPNVVKLVAVPAGCMAAGGLTWAGLGSHTGDLGTPAAEIGAGYAGSWAAAVGAGVAMYAVDRTIFERKPDRVLQGALVPTAVIGVVVPLAAGGATFLASEQLEGRSAHPDQVLAGALAGAAAGEILWGASSWYCKTPNAVGPVSLAFVPVGAGAALGMRLARGPSGREKPLIRAPAMLVVRF